ncbi:pilus assembly protein CpaD [Alteromonadaceae bacterium M269]|nr:pilus assembly protein CpaD [Alteromonadaceae bacterium M269]
MASINLMPWREEQRRLQKQNYLAVLGLVALVCLGLAWGVGEVIDQQISNQKVRNQFIERETKILDAQIEKIKSIKEDKQAIEQRMALIEQLQASRNVTPHIADELARIVPPGIAFRNMTRKSNLIEVEGVSESNNRLADFMRRLEQSKVFINGELSSIVADTSASDAVSDFKLTFYISPSIAPDFTAVEEGATNP